MKGGLYSTAVRDALGAGWVGDPAPGTACHRRTAAPLVRFALGSDGAEHMIAVADKRRGDSHNRSPTVTEYSAVREESTAKAQNSPETLTRDPPVAGAITALLVATMSETAWISIGLSMLQSCGQTQVLANGCSALLA